MSPPTLPISLVVHGHFYQPPRENPWLETVETQDSAAPYHDWNERITAECYAPNGAAPSSARSEVVPTASTRRPVIASIVADGIA